MTAPDPAHTTRDPARPADTVLFAPRAWVCFRRRRYYDKPNSFCLLVHGDSPVCGWREMLPFNPDDDWVHGPDAAHIDGPDACAP